MTQRIILASQSQSRQKAMDILGLSYECIPACIDEKSIRHTDPLVMARLISEAKAEKIAQNENGVIIAGDAFVVLNGNVLEKPVSLEEAHEMLHSLSGNKYVFVTALAVYDTETKKMRSSVATCDVYFKKITHDEIINYCNRYQVLKFAGAHETDGVSRFAEKIEGRFTLQTAICLQDLTLFLNEIFCDKQTAQEK